MTYTMKFSDGRPIEVLDQLLRERMNWLGESAENSCAATAINTLVSLRSATKLAKKSSVKVEVVLKGNLKPSFTSGRSVCVRDASTNARIEAKIAVASPTTTFKDCQVYYFNDKYSKNKSEYMIIALNKKDAVAKAKKIVMSRIKRYAGLARCALSKLMSKTGKSQTMTGVNSLTQNTADRTTKKVESRTKETYRLSLTDELDYAVDAVKGKQGGIDDAMKKALNKTVSVINMKMPDGAKFFGMDKLPMPFPEVAQRKR